MLEQIKNANLIEMSKEELEEHCEAILKLEKEEIKEYLFYVIDEYLDSDEKVEIPVFMKSFKSNKHIKAIMDEMLKEVEELNKETDKLY